jgi:hypothetical protein
LEQSLLSSRQRQPHPQGEDHERVIRAREAAEALFASKPPSADPPSAAAEPAAAAIRKPRVLQVIAPAPAGQDDVPHTPPVASAPPAREIPRSEFARIRTWVKYGMTVPQVAKLFGAEIDEIRRILQKI